MKFTVIRSKMKEDYLYSGVIKKHGIRDNKLLLFIEFDEEKGIEYLKSIPVDKREGSAFVRFFEQIGLMDEKGNVDTSSLDLLPIWATIKRTKDGQIFVDKIEVHWDEISVDEEEEYEDDEDYEEYEEDEE